MFWVFKSLIEFGYFQFSDVPFFKVIKLLSFIVNIMTIKVMTCFLFIYLLYSNNVDLLWVLNRIRVVVRAITELIGRPGIIVYWIGCCAKDPLLFAFRF